MPRRYYSQRKSRDSKATLLDFEATLKLFIRVYDQFTADGYFTEAFGFRCSDSGWIKGKIRDVELELALTVHNERLWPIEEHSWEYFEDDLFDLIEFLYQHVSKPIAGTPHDYNGCGMHWETFDSKEGRADFRLKMNAVLERYENRFELSAEGEVLRGAQAGFEPIFDAVVPTNERSIQARIDSAIKQYRRHGSTLHDRRQAVRDLADVLEFVRPQLKGVVLAKDEDDLFNIANNFGLRHHNQKQKTDYDANLWLSWMFYVYLATIHVVLRKIGQPSP